MPFITQGKANIKYLFVVVLVATIAGGIIFTYWKDCQREIINLNNFTEIIKPEKKIEEKISDNGLKVNIKISDNQYWLAIVENGKEKIIDSCLIFNNTLRDEDLGKFCSYYNLSLSPQKNYLIYSKEGYEWYGIFLYNIKTGEKRDFPDAHIVGLTGDEKYLFVCADNAFGGTYYGKVYNNKSLEEIYSVPEEYSHGIGNCGYDSSRNIIFFDSTDEFKPTGDMIDYNLETNKADITNYKHK